MTAISEEIDLAEVIVRCAKLLLDVLKLANHFRSQIVDPHIKLRNILLRRHVLDDMR
jgi:hypothetical protein